MAGEQPVSTGIRRSGLGDWPGRLLLLLAGLLVPLILFESALRLLHLPHRYAPHTAPAQFSIPELRDGRVFYTNRPSDRIRFLYDGNPRGYFGKHDEVDHVTNALGFRGPAFSSRKPPGTFRIAFLGDSFTFGEGVRFEDTYAEVTARLLAGRHRGSGLRFESHNFGVGGYNTEEELYVLKTIALREDPDAVVLGYVLNDAESAPYERDIVTGAIIKRPSELAVLVYESTRPPRGFLYRFRTARLVRDAMVAMTISRRTVEYYRTLYTDANPAWATNRNALVEFLRLCRARRIPCFVVCFPMLYHLDAGYPFREVHEKIRKIVEGQGGVFIDLYPNLQGRDSETLWVHPADHHPNEIVHRIAAGALVARMERDGGLAARIRHAEAQARP